MRLLPTSLLVIIASCVHQAPPSVEGGVRVAQKPPEKHSTPVPGASDDAEVPFEPGKRLNFQNGEPQIAIRLMEGREEVLFSSSGRMRIKLAADVEKWIDASARNQWRVKRGTSQPAEVETWVQLAEFPLNDKEGLAEDKRLWESRQVAVRAHILGSVYGVSGKVIDNRKSLLLLDETFNKAQALAKQKELLQQYGVRTQLFERLKTPARGILEVIDAKGATVSLSQNLIEVETSGEPIDVEQVEYGVGYDFHGFENRSYRGRLQISVDRNGMLAVVNLVPLEQLLMGLVPSEIFAKAHPEALKAQAVTARGEVLAKVGLKHLVDPYLLCAEQHCAVYRGMRGETASTNAAVLSTRGEGLFSRDGRLVDSVYSAVCGGHTENNEIVWGGPPNPSLRGKPDTLPEKQSVVTPATLTEFLKAELPVACRLSSFAQPSKYRWERRFSAAEVNRLTAHLGVGEVMSMALSDRGVSGRARVLTVSGTQGATGVRGELNIRKLFKMLPSSMFELDVERAPEGAPRTWIFKGGGWGHGVGMCQTGAIGRAEAGQNYKQILEHYFNGARVAPLH